MPDVLDQIDISLPKGLTLIGSEKPSGVTAATNDGFTLPKGLTLIGGPSPKPAQTITNKAATPQGLSMIASGENLHTGLPHKYDDFTFEEPQPKPAKKTGETEKSSVQKSPYGVIRQGKPETFMQKLEDRFSRTETGRTVESNLDQFSRMMRSANEKLANPGAMTDKEWENRRNEQKAFIEKHIAQTLGTGRLAKATTGVAMGAAEFGEELLSPYQVALMVGTFGESGLVDIAAKTGIKGAVPAAKTLSKLMQLQFASQMIEGAATGAENTVKAAWNGDWESAGQNAIEGLASGLMAKGIASHELATERVRTDIEKQSGQMYGQKFDTLSPYQQGAVIDATVKSSPEYQDVLKMADDQVEQAKDRTKKQQQKKLANYYGRAVEQAWEPNAAKRTIRGLEKGRAARAGMEAEEARQKSIHDVVGTIREAAERRAKAINDEFEARRQAGAEERPERKQGAAQARTERQKLSDEIKDKRTELYNQRQESNNRTLEVAQRHVEAVRDDNGNVSYSANYWGEENSFGVASDLKGHAVYRITPRGTEWLDADGNFTETPDNLFNVTDPQTADTVARLSSLSATADSLADAEGSTQEQKEDAEKLADIRRNLVNGEISAKEAQKQAGISEKVNLSDQFAAAWDGKLNGPFHESSANEYLSQVESEAQTAGMSDEDVDELIRNAGALARSETESNLNHVYQPGDYIVSKRGIRWTLDAKRMLHPDDGGPAVPLMNKGFYSNPAMQLAESGRVGYGTETREERRLKAARQRSVADAIRENQEKVRQAMRLATQQEGLQLATPEEPRPDFIGKQAVERRRMSRPPRRVGIQTGHMAKAITEMALQAPSDPNSIIQSIARMKEVSPEEVMRIQLANDPELTGTTQQKIAGLEVGDKVIEAIRKSPWIVEQRKDGLYLRSGNAQPLKLDRLNPSEAIKNLVERGAVEKEITPKVLENIAFVNPHYVRWENNQADTVQSRTEGKNKDPEPKTEIQAKVQSQAAKRRSEAVVSKATQSVIESLEPKTDILEEAEQKVIEAEKDIKLAEEGYAQAVEAESKTEPQDAFPQKAPVSIGLKGTSGVIRQNQREIPFHYELVPIDSLTTSHEWHGSILIPNPRFPEALQPRTISEGESQQNALRAKRGTYDFREYAGLTISGAMGPAIVDEGGDVAGGNTRIAILRKHLQELDSIPDSEEKDSAKRSMTSAMRRLALDSGIARYPEDGTFYVVTRMLDEPIRDTRRAAELGRLFNKKIGVEITKSAKGVSYSKSFDEPLLEDLGRRVESYDGIVPAMEADPEFFRGIVLNRFDVTPEEYADWFQDIPGRGLVLHDEGRNQFVKALLGTVVKDTSILNRIEGKMPYGALERGLGYVVKMRGIPDRNISEKIVEAMRASAQTIDTDPNLSASRDKWRATYQPDQQEFLGMETDTPPEPDRMTEAIWRAANSGPRTLNDRLKSFIGEETSKGGWLLEAQVETPTEAFNRAFKKELREVQLSRGDNAEGLTQKEYDASLRNETLSDEEREESKPKEEIGEPKKPEQAKVAVSKKMERPPAKPTVEETATEQLGRDKAVTGYVTPTALKEFLETNPATKDHAPELMRTARLMAEYVYDADPPSGIERKNALDWVLRERLAGIESGELKTKRGQYSDPNIEKGFGDKILKLHQASDPTTFIHEFAHVIFPLLSDEDLKAINTIRGRGDHWDGSRKTLSGEAYAGLSERFAHGLEQFLRDENPTGFTHEVKAVLAKVKSIMRNVYLAFKSDPLSEYRNTEESREIFAKMFGVTDFDVADEWRDELKKARAEEKRMTRPSEEKHPLVKMASDAGAARISSAMEGKVEDSVGDRIDPRKPTAVLVFGSQYEAKAAAAWTSIGTPESKIQSAELIQSPNGEWGIRFNTKAKVPPDILNQELPEKHLGLQLDDLEKRMNATPAHKMLERRLLQLRIDNLKNQIRAAYGAEELQSIKEATLPEQVREEVKNGKRADSLRAGTHGISGIQKPERAGRISKPPIMGMPGHEIAGQRGRPARSAVARVASLTEVTPVSLEPLSTQRSEPVGTLKGEAFDQKAWTDSLKRAGLPENAPPPTYVLDPKTAQVLKFPGQKQIVQMAMSALQQGDGFVLASSTGSGKTWSSMGIIREFRSQNPDALVLHITKNRGLLKDAQKVAANSFGFHVETDAPEEGAKSGVFGASYIGLLNNKIYKSMPWDLVIADESGEARNWFRDENKIGKNVKDIISSGKKAVYVSATPFHAPQEYGYLDKLNLWPKGQFDKWIEDNFAHEKIGDKIVARLDPSKQAKLRQQLIERGQMVSQAISYEGMTAHFGIVPVTDSMKRSLDRIREGFARARDQFVKQGKKGMAEKAAAFEATYTKAFLERERIPQIIELAKKARNQGWQVMIFSETSAEDLFRRPRSTDIDPSTYQELDDAMGGQLSKIIPPFEDVFDRLREEFGPDIVDYSGRGNTMASRDAAKNDFLAGKAPMLYTTYAAGGIGVSLHDADYPDLNIKGGDKPRVALFLGPPYSGVLLEQAMGRPWRFGVKSDVHLAFLATDSEPDVRLMQTKIGPRMRALRAAVLGEKDSLASVMQTYNDDEKVRARQDMLAYSEGDEVRVNAGSYNVRSKSRNVGINDWSQIDFPPAESAKNRGMKYGEEVGGGDWSTLFQSKFDPMKPPDSKENEAGKKVINEIGNAAVSGKVPSVQELDGADRQTVTALSAATATQEVDIPVDRDKKATALQSMDAQLRNNHPFPYYGLVMSQELGMENIARRDDKPEVGRKLKLMNRSYRADYDVARGQYWNMLEDTLKRYHLKPEDAVIKELSYVLEGKRTTDNPDIAKAAADISDMMRMAHQDLSKAGVRVKIKTGQAIPYSTFEEDPHYFPHRIDWDHRVTDPLTGETHTLKEIMKDKFDERMRQRILENIPDLKPYSYTQVLDYLRRHEPRSPILSHIHRAREVNFPYIRRDYQTLIGYFDQVAQSISAAKNFGVEEEKLNDQINRLTTIDGKNTIQSMFRSVLAPQEWSDVTAKIYNGAIAYEAASKMTFSAFKVPFHLGLVPIGMEGRVRPLARALGRTLIHPREVMENAAYVGTLSRQLSAADIYYGERVSTPVRQILRKEMFESAYKMVRAISGESAKIYLEQYAMNDLRKGGARAQHVRRLLNDTFFIGNQGIDEAVKAGRFNQEDLAKAQTAFSNLVAFSDDPLQMPQLARAEIAKGESLPIVGLKRAVRLTYALQSFSLKATSLLREKLYDEVVIHKNYKPLAYAIVASPIIGQMLSGVGAGAKHVLHRGLEGLSGKQHTQDSWDKYLQNLETTFEHPEAVGLLKFIVDGYTLGYGWDAVKTVCDPFMDLASGSKKKAGQGFDYMIPDLVEHMVGGFFDDIYKAGKEIGTLGQIASGTKHPEQKTEKEERSLIEFATEQVPALRDIPWVAEHMKKPKKTTNYYR